MFFMNKLLVAGVFGCGTFCALNGECLARQWPGPTVGGDLLLGERGMLGQLH